MAYFAAYCGLIAWMKDFSVAYPCRSTVGKAMLNKRFLDSYSHRQQIAKAEARVDCFVLEVESNERYNIVYIPSSVCYCAHENQPPPNGEA